jgi:hypothetical protein
VAGGRSAATRVRDRARVRRGAGRARPRRRAGRRRDLPAPAGTTRIAGACLRRRGPVPAHRPGGPAAGPEALDRLLAAWRDHLAAVPQAAAGDSAALIAWPSRDITGSVALLRRGFACRTVLAARPAGHPASSPYVTGTDPGISVAGSARPTWTRSPAWAWRSSGSTRTSAPSPNGRTPPGRCTAMPPPRSPPPAPGSGWPNATAPPPGCSTPGRPTKPGGWRRWCGPPPPRTWT